MGRLSLGLISLFTLGLVSITNTQANEAGDYSCTEVPVNFNYEGVEFSDDAEVKEAQERIKRLIETRVKKIAGCNVILPTTKFDGRTQTIKMDDLFKTPEDQIDLRALARDENGEPKDLTDEQVAAIRKTGKFSVADDRFPGKHHVWQVSTLIQSGTDSINIEYKQGLADSLIHVYVYLPERLWGSDTWSVRNGFVNIFNTLQDIASNAVGLTEMAPKYDSYEISNLVAAEKVKHSLGAAVQVDEKNDPFVFQVTEDLIIDLSIFDTRIMKKATPIIKAINAEIKEDWIRKEKILEGEVYKKLRDDGVDENIIDQRVADYLVLQKRNERLDAILASNELRDLRENLPELIVNYFISYIEYYTAEKKLQAAAKLYKAQVTHEIKMADPIKAMMGDHSYLAPVSYFEQGQSWLERQVAQKVAEFKIENQFSFYEQAKANLEQQGLAQEAYLLDKHLEFIAEKEKAIIANLKSEIEPAVVNKYYYRYWDSDNYQVENHGTDEEPYYVLKKHYYKTVKSDGLGWRGDVWFNRTASIWKNSNDALIYDNLWNGPLGLKALFKADPFAHEWDVDPKTGEKVFIGQMPTYWSNLKSIWEYVDAADKEFEERDDYGLFGKTFAGFLHNIWYKGVVGFGGTVVVGIGQPVVTLANTAVSSIASATSFIWSPIAAGVANVYDIVIYDTLSPAEHPNQDEYKADILPIVQNAVKTGLGVVEVGTSAVLGVVWHPAMALIKGAYTNVETAVEHAYEWLIGNTIIEFLARVPAMDTTWVTRVEGPGLESSYFFQVSPEVIMVALQGELEATELKFYEAKAVAERRGPKIRFEQFMNDLLLPFVQSQTASAEIMEEIGKPSAKFLEELQKSLEERKKLLRNVNDFKSRYVEGGYLREKIRLQAADLERTLKLATILIQEFYTNRIFVGMSEKELDEFWYDQELRKDNWIGLAENRLSELFSPAFLVALEDEKSDFIIRVETRDLKDVYSDIINKEYETKANNLKAKFSSSKIKNDVTSDLVTIPTGFDGPYLMQNPAYLGNGYFLTEEVLKDREEEKFQR